MATTLLAVSTTSPAVSKGNSSHYLGPKAFDTLLSTALERFRLSGGQETEVRGKNLLSGWRMTVKSEDGLTHFCLAFYGPVIRDKDAKPTVRRIHNHPGVAKLVLVESFPDIRLTMFTGILCPCGGNSDDRA